MQVIEKGHIYRPQYRTPEGHALGDTIESVDGVLLGGIVFVNKQPGQEHAGTTTQELLRVLLDRTRHCANCMPHRNNEQIIYHLRMALVLHEARALERKVEKGLLDPEYMQIGDDGHFMLNELGTGLNHTRELIPHRNDWDRPCNHPAAGE